MEDKDDLAVVEREEPPRHKQSFDIRKAAAGLVDGAGSAMAGAVATVQKVADGAMRAATPMVDDALAAIADAADGAAGAAADIGDAVNDWAYQQQLNRYRPVTKETYQSPSFYLPNMIRIVDGNERRHWHVSFSSRAAVSCPAGAGAPLLLPSSRGAAGERVARG